MKESNKNKGEKEWKRNLRIWRIGGVERVLQVDGHTATVHLDEH